MDGNLCSDESEDSGKNHNECKRTEDMRVKPPREPARPHERKKDDEGDGGGQRRGKDQVPHMATL